MRLYNSYTSDSSLNHYTGAKKSVLRHCTDTSISPPKYSYPIVISSRLRSSTLPHPKYHQIPPEYSFIIALRSTFRSTIIARSNHHQISPSSTWLHHYNVVTIPPPKYSSLIVNSSRLHSSTLPHLKYHQISPYYNYTNAIRSTIHSTTISRSNHHQISPSSTLLHNYNVITISPPKYSSPIVISSHLHSITSKYHQISPKYDSTIAT